MTNSFIYDFYCIIAPPDPIPNKLRIVGICDTTAELAWEKPEEVGRDDFYYSINRTNPDTSEEIVVNVNYIDNRDVVAFKVTNRSCTKNYLYIFCLCSQWSESI